MQNIQRLGILKEEKTEVSDLSSDDFVEDNADALELAELVDDLPEKSDSFFAKRILLLPIDYKLNNTIDVNENFPSKEDHERFELIARDQWSGLKAFLGRILYLYESNATNGSGFIIVSAYPENLEIGPTTEIRLLSEESFPEFIDEIYDYVSSTLEPFKDKGLYTISHKVVLEVAGYLNDFGNEKDIEIDNMDLFKSYIKEQWRGTEVFPGAHLFDYGFYRGLGFKVVEAHPAGVIGPITEIDIIIPEQEEEIEETEKPKFPILFENVVGQSAAKKKCKIIERYLKEPERFGKWAPRNVLFYGPSGTGKTMLARALANEVDVPFFSVKATNLIGEFVGEGSRQIHELYEKAEEMAPCIVFIDEIDAIALDRQYQELRGDVLEIVNALITEMDGLSERQGICTIGSTNRIATIDPAIRSRFEEEIEFVLPNAEEIENIIKLNIETFPIPSEQFSLKSFSKKAVGLSGRDLVEKILKKAIHKAIIEDLETIPAKYFYDALNELKKEDKSKDCQRLYA
ncbi:MAG: AAA family ATPase [Methanosarcinaceae archaeon]|nr:AAA family ATPase [Methanosarcinaceae archaeon]